MWLLLGILLNQIDLFLWSLVWHNDSSQIILCREALKIEHMTRMKKIFVYALILSFAYLLHSALKSEKCAIWYVSLHQRLKSMGFWSFFEWDWGTCGVKKTLILAFDWGKRATTCTLYNVHTQYTYFYNFLLHYFFPLSPRRPTLYYFNLSWWHFKATFR